MDRLLSMRVFQQVADAGSFAAGLGATSLAANSVAVGTGANASGGSIGTGAGGLGSNVLAPGSVAIGNNFVSDVEGSTLWRNDQLQPFDVGATLTATVKLGALT